MIKAVIFDIYGTLLYSDCGDLNDSLENRENQEETMSQLIEKYNLNTQSEEIIDHFFTEIEKDHKRKENKGLDYPEVKIEHIWRNVFEELNLPKINFKKFAWDYYNIGSDRRLYNNVKFILDFLQSKNIELGIVSNAQFYTIDDMENKLDIDDLSEYFNPDLTIFSFEEKVSKPNELLFDNLIKALEKVNIKPQETLFVGNDMECDVDASINSGLKAVLLDWKATKWHEKKDLEDPTYIINELKEIKTLIDHENGKSNSI